MTEKLAPIAIPTYTRINHLKSTIEALQKNPLAKESDLYIYSDGPKMGDEEKVRMIREYIKTITGFKSLNLIARENNDFIKNNYGCIEDILNKYGKIIFMEDDIVTAPGFLSFMNAGLDFYKDNKNILTINGYNLPAKFPNNYRYDYFLSKHYNAWGLGTWQDRDIVGVMNYNGGYDEIMRDKKLFKKIYKVYPALIDRLKKIKDGLSNAGDFKVAFHSIKNDMLNVRPVKSLIQNIGFDGTGIHCGTTDRYYIENLSDKVFFSFNNISYEEKMDAIWYDYLKPTSKWDNLPKRIKNKLRKILGIEKTN